MTDKITIEALQLTGFRAYLQEQLIPLSRGGKPISLAVFSPNAKGKSSLVDAFEFFFSSDATLERLGIRAMDRNAGRPALEHAEAQAKGITGTVCISFRQGKEIFSESRTVAPGGTPVPAAALRVLAKRVLPFVIRGHELRKFVEGQTPEDRHREIVAWFGWQPLLAIQTSLRALRRQVKQKAESQNAFQERMRDLTRMTNNSVKDWNEAKICTWFNENVSGKLDNTLVLEALSIEDNGYIELDKRKKAEDLNLGLASLNRLLNNVEAFYRTTQVEGEDPRGAASNFKNALTNYRAAASGEAAERAKASQATFSSVWTAAKKLFEDENLPLETCPVCDTDIPATPHGTREAIRVRLDAKLGDLSDYRAAEINLRAHQGTLSEAHRALITCLGTLNATLEDSGYAHRTTSVAAYKLAVTTWKTEDVPPDDAAAISEVRAVHEEIAEEKKRIEEKQGEHTYANSLKIADDLLRVKTDLERIERAKEELAKLKTQLDQQSQAINRAIGGHTQRLIGILKSTINVLYGEIQGPGSSIPPIRLELPGEEDINQQRIELLVDFADTRKGVVPSGYLSDSQIHALALSFRLAAIQTFNSGIPVIVLDDVVTSYDADHRKNIAAMLGKHFASYQLILVTHDERFFALLQDHVAPATWSFKRITELKLGFGPLFHDHRTPDEVIQEKLDQGQSCGNEIRQAEEEWLLDICRGFRTKVIIRPIERPYKYERSELAGALAAFLNSAGITPPTVPGIANPFLTSLQKGDLENFASHFSDNPNESASAGDERTRWAEFKYFRDKFACPQCASTRFARPEPLKLPVCNKCNVPFSFKTSGAAG